MRASWIDLWQPLAKRWHFYRARWAARVLARRAAHRSARRMATVDYRDRISVAVWLIVAGLGVTLLFDLPSFTFNFWALGSPISIELTDTILTALFLSVLAAAGAESVIRVHPRFALRRRGRTWSYWALPMAITIISVVLLPLAPSAFLQVLALILSGLLLGVAFYSLGATVEQGRTGFRRARLTLDALAYGCALLLFLFVYQSRTRSLLSGTLVALTATLLAIEILRTATAGRSSIAVMYGGIVGMILGQVTWALNYWVLPGLTGGLLLLLIFYLLVGIAQQGLQERLTRRVFMEFLVFGVIALMLIVLVGPGFSP